MMPAGMVGEAATLLVEPHVELLIEETLVEPCPPEHQLPQPVDETLVLVHEGFVPEAYKVFPQSTHWEMEGTGGDQLHKIGALVVVEAAGFHEVKLRRRRLDTLREINGVEAEAKTTELKDVVFAGAVVRMRVVSFSGHAHPQD
jgi:hypothetical protein